jgi:predicted transposase YbfD/YdcC
MGQLKVDSKSNEITAIPELLKVLEIAGCIVTIDAMCCQKEIVKEIVRQKADYVITLKENQANLYKDVEELFRIIMQREFQGLEHSKYTIKDLGHGREEIRHYVMISGIKSLLDINSDWVNLNSVGMVEHIRKEKGETTVEIRYRTGFFREFTGLLGTAITVPCTTKTAIMTKNDKNLQYFNRVLII